MKTGTAGETLKTRQYTFKTDTLSKMLYVSHPDLLKKLVAVLLGISYKSIAEFHIQNGALQPERLKGRFCRLDINMIVDGQLVDLENQVCNEGDYIARMMFYWAKEFSSALGTGENYVKLPRTLVINIVDFVL